MPLLEEEAPRDPFVLFDRWFREATDAGALQPDAMTLATSGEEGPSARMVLFKGIEDGTFLFYSNYGSRKGRDLSHDRRAALVFYWPVTRHQVRVYGVVRKVGRAASERYFHSRPSGAQISALASRQSHVLRSREQIEQRVLELAAKYPDEVPLPKDWGGYALRPIWIEFWEHREDRLHDRLRYVFRSAYTGAWRIERLAP
ncbi:MAG TPA: pyridoxamine 5'-phosphate oxidase [Candidatus Dormibacteraeota bacterium]|jgi:pyridoxamine 5'-phosphate oxidase